MLPVACGWWWWRRQACDAGALWRTADAAGGRLPCRVAVARSSLSWTILGLLLCSVVTSLALLSVRAQCGAGVYGWRPCASLAPYALSSFDAKILTHPICPLLAHAYFRNVSTLIVVFTQRGYSPRQLRSMWRRGVLGVASAVRTLVARAHSEPSMVTQIMTMELNRHLGEHPPQSSFGVSHLAGVDGATE